MSADQIIVEELFFCLDCAKKSPLISAMPDLLTSYAVPGNEIKCSSCFGVFTGHYYIATMYRDPKIPSSATFSPDMVNHPPHYTKHPSGIECIEVTRHMNFNLGNVVKYCWRTDHKNGLEDLKKARWYLEDEIKRLERQVAVEITKREGQKKC